MKSRNYLLILLSLTLTGMTALAVDYVACREMIRTKNEFVSISNQYEKLELGTRLIYDTKKDTQKWSKCYGTMWDKVKTGEEIEEEIKKISTCEQNQREEKNRRRNQGETKRMGLHFITDEGHYYYKKALKVEADMKSANCPY